MTDAAKRETRQFFMPPACRECGGLDRHKAGCSEAPPRPAGDAGTEPRSAEWWLRDMVKYAYNGGYVDSDDCPDDVIAAYRAEVLATAARQAREEGRREGLEEAVQFCKPHADIAKGCKDDYDVGRAMAGQDIRAAIWDAIRAGRREEPLHDAR